MKIRAIVRDHSDYNHTAFRTEPPAFVYVLRRLRQIEKTIVSGELVPKELGPRNNLVLMICAIPIIVVALLLYLIVNL